MPSPVYQVLLTIRDYSQREDGLVVNTEVAGRNRPIRHLGFLFWSAQEPRFPQCASARRGATCRCRRASAAERLHKAKYTTPSVMADPPPLPEEAPCSHFSILSAPAVLGSGFGDVPVIRMGEEGQPLVRSREGELPRLPTHCCTLTLLAHSNDVSICAIPRDYLPPRSHAPAPYCEVADGCKGGELRGNRRGAPQPLGDPTLDEGWTEYANYQFLKQTLFDWERELAPTAGPRERACYTSLRTVLTEASARSRRACAATRWRRRTCGS